MDNSVFMSYMPTYVTYRECDYDYGQQLIISVHFLALF